ncbi:hypothetical protein V8F33_001864 [Rhypophila sp. PSN 637]
MSGTPWDFGFIGGTEYRTLLAARENLQHQVADQHTHIVALNGELKDAKKQLLELAEARQKIQAMRDTNDQLRQKFEQDIQKMQNDACARLKALKDECNKLQKEAEISEKKHQGSRLALESCQQTMVPKAELDQLKKTMVPQAELDQLKKTTVPIAELDELKVIYNKELESLHKYYAGEIAKKTDRLRETYGQQLANLEESQGALAQEMQALGEIHDQSKKKLAQQHNTIEERDKTIEHLTKTMNAGQAQGSLVVKKLRSAYNVMEKQQSLIDDLTKKVKSSEDRELILQGKHNNVLSARNKTIEEQRSTVADLTKTIDNLTKTVKTSEDRELILESNFKAQLSYRNKIIEEQRSTIEDLTKKVKTAEDRELILNGNHNNKLSHRNTIIEEQRSTIEDLTKKVKTSEDRELILEANFGAQLSHRNNIIEEQCSTIEDLTKKVRTAEDRELILEGNHNNVLSYRDRIIEEQRSAIEDLAQQIEQVIACNTMRETTLVQKLTALKAEVDEGKLREQALRNTIADLKQGEEEQAAELTERIEEVGLREKMLEEQNSEIRELKEEQSALEGDVEYLEERLKDMRTLKDSLERERDNAKRDAEAQREIIGEQQERHAALLEQCGLYQQVGGQLAFRLEELEAEVREVEGFDHVNFSDAESDDKSVTSESFDDDADSDITTLEPEEDDLIELCPADIEGDLIELGTADPAEMMDTEQDAEDEVLVHVDAPGQEQANDAVDDCGWCHECERCVPETCKECDQEFSIGGICSEFCGCELIDPDYCHYCNSIWLRTCPDCGCERKEPPYCSFCEDMRGPRQEDDENDEDDVNDEEVSELLEEAKDS